MSLPLSHAANRLIFMRVCGGWLTEDLAKPKESTPEFRVQLRDITTNVGEPATLDCQVVGFPRPEVFWTKARKRHVIVPSFLGLLLPRSGNF